MTRILHVINPNSSPHVTEAIALAALPFHSADLAIDCIFMADGPRGIETEADLHAAIGPMLCFVETRPEAAGFVIACFGDPGLHLLREKTGLPVFGIAECGALTAMTLGERFGVISILDAAIPRHVRYFRMMGVMSRFAGDRAIGMGVAALKDRDEMLGRMIEVGHKLKAQVVPMSS